MEKEVTINEIDAEGEMIQKIIHKAVEGGFNWKDFKPSIESADPFFCMVFSHKFAKAFFGNPTQWMYLSHGEAMDIVSEVPDKMEYYEEYEARNGWQYHLQAMVIESEPLDYLKKFLENEN